MPTKITFVGGGHVDVEQDAGDVRRLLTEDKMRNGEPFTLLKTTQGDDVFVAADQVVSIAAKRARSSTASFI